MISYLDQNVLIYLAKRDDWMATATKAAAQRSERFVLSPWHFYEIGKLTHERRRELLDVADQLQPSWILDRADIQMLEFLNAWDQLWDGTHKHFSPIGTLAEVAAFLLRTTPERLVNVSLADFVETFSKPGASSPLTEVFDSQKTIAAANQRSFAEGRHSEAVEREVQKRYLARLLARRGETNPSLSELNGKQAAILQDGFMNAKIDFFIDFVGFSELRAWIIESRLAKLHMAGNAVLNENRQVDRHHACAGLAYCGRFVTNDTELLNRSAEVSRDLPFTPAMAIRPEDFIEQIDEHG